MGINEKAWHVGFKWTTGDEDNPTGAIALDDSSDALHICEIADVATDWNVSTTNHPTLYLHSASDPATDYISMYHDGTSGIITLDGTTLFTLTATTVDIAVATTIAGDLDITTDDIAISQGYYMHFDGLGNNTEYIRSDTADYLMVNATTGINLAIGGTDKVNISTSACYPPDNGLTLGIQNTNEWSDLFLADGGVIGWNNNNVTITHSAGLLTISNALTVAGLATVNGNIAIPQGDYIYLDGNGGGEYIRSDTANELMVNATTNMNLAIGGTDEIRIDAAGVHIMSNNLAVAQGSYLYFDGDGGGEQIRAASAGNLTITSSGTGNAAINLVTGGPYTGTIQMYGYVRLLRTDTDGDLESQLWYDDSENRLKFYGASVVTVADLTNANAFTGQCNFNNAETWITSNNKLIFRSADYHIQSPAANQLTITSAGTGNAAINLVTGGYTGNIQCYGFLRLLRTGSVGSNEGEVWYDTVSNKIHFWNGTAEQEVTSGGA